MLRLKEGDAVRVADRAATPADAKSGLFYNYYRNLAGIVFKVYGSGADALVAVDVDLETLPEEVAKRHLEVRDQMRGNLTGEAKRASAPGGDQEMKLRYVILVALADLARKTTAPLRRANGKSAVTA